MIEIVTYPATKAISAEEAKRQLNILDTSRDTLIGEYIDAAQVQLYNYTSVAATEMVFKDTMRDFKTIIKLDVYPITAINSIQYYDANNSLQTLSASNYKVDLGRYPAEIEITTAPSVYDRGDAVIVNFTAGYSTVPNDVKQAMRMLVADLFEDRQSNAYGNVRELSGTTKAQLAIISKRIEV